MPGRFSAKRLRIRVTLPIAVTLLIGVTAAAVIVINYLNTTASLRSLAYEHMQQITDQTIEKMVNHLAAAENLVRLNRSISRGDIFRIDFGHPMAEAAKIKQLNSLLLLLYQEMTVYHQIAKIYLGDEAGDFWMHSRTPDGGIATENILRFGDETDCDRRLAKIRAMHPPPDKATVAAEVSGCIDTTWLYRDRNGNVTRREKRPAETYDPRIRPWYRAAKQHGELSWTDIYVFYTGQKPGITVSMPVYADNHYVGALGADIELEEISEFLKRLRIGHTGRAFIVNRKGEIVAFPDPSELKRTNEQNGRVIPNRITRVKDTAAAASWREIRELTGSTGDAPLRLDHQRLFGFKDAGEAYIAAYTPFPKKYAWHWVIGAIMPENDFLAGVKKSDAIIVAVSLIGMIGAILLGIQMSRTITRPLTQLSEETKAISRFELDNDLSLDSIFIEIGRMARAFDNMKAGLRSFRKFVPADLVRYLMQTGQEASLGGASRELTLFFADIAGFTGISETQDPERLVNQLGEYLEAVSGIIDRHGGTVDKFIGDAVMAFWGAPKAMAEHPQAACLAAAEILSHLEVLGRDWEARGLPRMRARIGIHTGPAIVGNIGSATRLNYTVIGDNVNLASRLEGLGKAYGVSCLVSDATHAAAGSAVFGRHIDRVAVKGRQQAVDIYELIATADKVTEADRQRVRRYEEALSAYFSRDWATALHGFEKGVALDNDGPSRILASRCRRFLAAPPEEPWDGVYRHDTK